MFQNLLDSVLALFKATRSTLPGLSINKLDEDVISVHQLPQLVSFVAKVYTNRRTLHYDPKWWSMERPKLVRTLIRSQSSGPSSKMEGAVPKRQCALHEKTGIEDPVTNIVKVNEEDQDMKVDIVTDPIASIEPGPHVIKGMRKVRETM